MKIVYLPYLIKNTDYSRISEYLDYVSKTQKISKARVFQNMMTNFFENDTAFLDYFYLGFYKTPGPDAKTYASTWYMYKFQKKLNDARHIDKFGDKRKFHQLFKEYIGHAHYVPAGKPPADFEAWLKLNDPNYIIVKNSGGQVGAGIEKFKVEIKSDQFLVNKVTVERFLKDIAQKNLDLIEVFIEQHPVLQKMSPIALSTIRVITILNKEGHVDIIAAILRMGTDKPVDNYDAGGVSAAIDVETGLIIGPVQYKDPGKPKIYEVHPITGEQVVEKTIPYYKEVLDLVRRATIVIPQVRTVGWDVVVTADGPFLLEGNHNWDKTHLQKSYGKGFKPILDSYL